MLAAMSAAADQLSANRDAKVADAKQADAQFGVHVARKVLPGIEFYRHQFQVHKAKGERDFEIAGCSGIEKLISKIGQSPTKIRVWRLRYGHLPEFRAALTAMGKAPVRAVWTCC